MLGFHAGPLSRTNQDFGKVVEKPEYLDRKPRYKATTNNTLSPLACIRLQTGIEPGSFCLKGSSFLSTPWGGEFAFDKRSSEWIVFLDKTFFSVLLFIWTVRPGRMKIFQLFHVPEWRILKWRYYRWVIHLAILRTVLIETDGKRSNCLPLFKGVG